MCVEILNVLANQVWDVSTEFITEHRAWFVVIFVLPFSLLFDVFFAIRAYIVMVDRLFCPRTHTHTPTAHAHAHTLHALAVLVAH
jgi:hypothetical protein